MQQRNPRTIRDMTVLGGWLFADLLLALMVIFLAATPPFPKPLPATPTPAPTFSPTPTPAPTQVPRLDFQPVRITINNVDYNGILSNNPGAVRAMEQAINNQPVLRNRSIGLVVVYDGAQTDADIHTAQLIAQAVIDNVLKLMGRQEPLFQRASYYSPLYVFGPGHSTVVIDIYLFKQ